MRGKIDDMLERQSLVFIQYSNKYLGIARKPREGLDHLEDGSEAFGKFPVPKGTFGKSF
jgi:hypothetical protein